MAVAATNLTTAQSGSGATSYTTASVSPTTGNLVLIAVAHQVSSGTPNIPTITGNGLTWVQVTTILASSSGLRRLTVFRALGTASAGTIVIDFAGQSQVRCAWSVAEFTGMVTTGANGADAIVQFASAERTDGAASTGVTVTLATFSNINNATYGALRYGGGSTADNVLEGASFTRIGLVNGSASCGTEFAATNQTSVNWTWNSGSLYSEAIGIEIAAFVASTGNTGMHKNMVSNIVSV